jgi:hypothetical protein
LPVAATPDYLALRTPQYTYVEYQGGFHELYDLKQDPYELNNIASIADSSLCWLNFLVGLKLWLLVSPPHVVLLT